MAPKLLMKDTSLQQVLDPQYYLAGVERLADEILRPEGESPSFHLRRTVAGDDHDGEMLDPGRERRQLCQHLESIFDRHVKIQENEVRPALRVEFHYASRVRRGRDVGIAGSVQRSEERRVGEERRLKGGSAAS